MRLILVLSIALLATPAYSMPYWLENGGSASGGAGEIPIGETVTGDAGGGSNVHVDPPAVENAVGDPSGG